MKDEAEEPISLDKIKMNVVATGDGGEVNDETVFRFAQDGEFVSAEYSGGGVRIGFLVGTISGAKLCFRYVQIGESGHLDSGHSICEIKRRNDGKIRLIEHFAWDSREGTGINVFEEI